MLLTKILSVTSAFFLLGSVWADSNDKPQAIATFRKVLQMDPDHAEALNALGYTYAEQGIYLDDAIRMIRRAIAIDPSNGAYEDSLGWAFYKKGSYAEALTALQKAATQIQDELLDQHLAIVQKKIKDIH